MNIFAFHTIFFILQRHHLRNYIKELHLIDCLGQQCLCIGLSDFPNIYGLGNDPTYFWNRWKLHADLVRRWLFRLYVGGGGISLLTKVSGDDVFYFVEFSHEKIHVRKHWFFKLTSQPSFLFVFFLKKVK